VFPDIASLPLPLPADLAKAAASLDLLTGGRVELGLGAGAFWDAIEAMGGPRRGPGDSVTALREAIAVTKLVRSGERSIQFDGDFYRVKGVHPGPVPAHPIGVWVGAYKPRMLRLVDGAAIRAGRDPSDIRRVLNVGTSIPVDDLPEQLTRLALDDGIDGFILGGPPNGDALGYLAHEVLPRVRDRVERPTVDRSAGACC
jgi:alkanesulfonate monooxygenase SsuD/methylene tetrahydromethanopterin reductase-like flavin-dependent oxidoreductase (luciferase family)